jgi:polyisoprenoid-binding protein YceI
MFGGVARLILITALPLVCLGISWAQDEGLRIDSEHSTASLTLVSADGTSSLNVGIAKVSGTVKLDSSNPADDIFDLNIYPARQGSRLLNSDGGFRSNGSADLSRYTVTSFRSDRASLNREGQLEITGELTITYVRRQANIYWNNAYDGPSYGQLVTQSTTHETTFILDNQSATASTGGNHGKGVISALATITRQDFPSLRTALLDAVWPIVVEDEHCEMPPVRASMRDYTGAVCTGTPVEVSPRSQPVQYYFGLDYPGAEETSPPPGDKATILVHLRWAQ